jgi:hypothetical protein
VLSSAEPDALRRRDIAVMFKSLADHDAAAALRRALVESGAEA